MTPGSRGVLAPRLREPELPRDLEDRGSISPHEDVVGALLTLGGTTEAKHAHIAESRLVLDGELVDLEGATLADVEVDDPKLVELRAPRSRWRDSRLEGGRIGTLDLAGAEIDAVELRGIRVDYLSLAQAKVRDLLLVDCVMRTVDLPLASLERVRFERCRADEVDTRGLSSRDLDLRGLEALSYTDVTALKGATMTEHQAVALAAEFAAALDIRLG